MPLQPLGPPDYSSNLSFEPRRFTIWDTDVPFLELLKWLFRFLLAILTLELALAAVAGLVMLIFAIMGISAASLLH